MFLDRCSIKIYVVSIDDSWIAENALSLRALISLEKPYHLLLYRAPRRYHPKLNDSVSVYKKEIIGRRFILYTIGGTNSHL